MSENSQRIESPVDARDYVGAFIGHLRSMADLRRSMNTAQDEWIWTSHEELVLNLVGEPTVVEDLALPEGVEPGQIRDCYRNAYLLSFANPRFTYVEGFAMGAFPVSHAWVLDHETGGIVDPTWVNLDSRQTAIYMGLPFTDAFIGRLVEECSLPSVFENDFTRRGRVLRQGLVLDKEGRVYDWGDPPPF